MIEQIVSLIVAGVTVFVITRAIGDWIFRKRVGKVKMLEERVGVIEGKIKELRQMIENDPTIIIVREEAYDFDKINIAEFVQITKMIPFKKDVLLRVLAVALVIVVLSLIYILIHLMIVKENVSNCRVPAELRGDSVTILGRYALVHGSS